jgi:hypothetical protein
MKAARHRLARQERALSQSAAFNLIPRIEWPINMPESDVPESQKRTLSSRRPGQGNESKISLLLCATDSTNYGLGDGSSISFVQRVSYLMLCFFWFNAQPDEVE